MSEPPSSHRRKVPLARYDGQRVRRRKFADGAAARGKWQELTGGRATAEDGGTALVAAGDATAYELNDLIPYDLLGEVRTAVAAQS
ncbi:hypothetical protein [Streptomyces turgidiscabies]|uniref:Uncharacterized protein n=1 Tax=Streptomyces turgidiscabies TaxID=85558 RepID=A0ABU0RSA8_9ACTN|nr:hypothetical protein [Streptomyces turgidiscabies]MDQ0934865.1 hypothetical protein [Streptomyces turgidiscabies]